MRNRIFLCLLAMLLLCGCQRTAAVEAKSGSDFLNEVYFLGDSITAHMAQRSEIDEKQILATKERYLNLDSRITYAKIIAPDSGEEEGIAAVISRLQPRYLIITLGVDYGVYYYRNDLSVFAKYYEKLLDAILEASPKTQPIIQSILPVAKSCTVLTNQMIDNANAALRELSVKRGVPYLDTQSVLRDGDGYLRTEYCYSEDGIHLNEGAYRKMLSYITKTADEMGWND